MAMPLEALRAEQLGVVNQLRRSLITGPAASVNLQVKTRLATLAAREGWLHIMDWGCGYHSLRDLLPTDARLSCVDVDPEVVS
jgi:hypothetical protein